MRMYCVFVSMATLGIFSTTASADIQSYCEVYGQDFANGKTSDVDAWADHFRNAFGDCMIRYAAEAGVGAAAKKVVVVPARDSSRKKRTPILAAGSIAWNNYCASKYASFNPATGNYKSHAGKQRPCLVPSN
jgi:BA14K-like protein